MNTIILTKEARGDRSSGVWLRDLGFQLIEAGCEINMTRAEGDAAREVLAKYGMEVAFVMEGFGPKAETIRQQPRAGASAAGETIMKGYAPHERYGGAQSGVSNPTLS